MSCSFITLHTMVLDVVLQAMNYKREYIDKMEGLRISVTEFFRTVEGKRDFTDAEINAGPVTENVLAKVVGVNRATIRRWHEQGKFKGTFYCRGRTRYYTRDLALQRVREILTTSRRKKLLDGEIFKGELNDS